MKYLIFIKMLVSVSIAHIHTKVNVFQLLKTFRLSILKLAKIRFRLSMHRKENI